MFHIKNQHEWNNGVFVHEYQHPPLTSQQQQETLWLKETSPAYIELVSIINDKKLINDLQYLTEFSHTGGLEVYHALLGKYCPKNQHFSYLGMQCRSQLAALDFNAGAGLQQARTHDGQPRFNIAFSKQSKQWVAKPIKEHKNK